MSKHLYRLTVLVFLIAAFNLQGQHFVVKADDEPLNKVFISLQEKYSLQLSFNDALLQECKVTDSSSYLTAELAIQALVNKCGLAYQIQDDVFIIFQPKVKESVYRFTGKVVDQEDKEGLPFTQVVMGDDRFITDQNGNFAYQSKDSVMQLKMSYLGYRALDTVLTAGIQQTIIMQPSSVFLKEVVIEGKKKQLDSLNPQTPEYYESEAGKIKINHEVATFLPGNNSNTIFNLLRLQPGILAAGEQTNDYLIWGSYRGQTQIVYDGITMFNIGSYNDNVGAINPLMVKDIEVLKAGYNVQIGDRVGGVVNITGKSGNADKVTGNIQMNQLISSANINIPIAKKYTIQAAARYSYYDLFPNSYLKNDSPKEISSFDTESSFNDFNLKFSGKEKNGDQYYISTLKSNDERFSSIDDINERVGITREKNTSRKQNGVSAFYGKVWKRAGLTNTTLAYSSLETTTEVALKNQNRRSGIINQSNLLNGVSELSLKTDHTLPVIKGNQIQLGLGVIKNTSKLEGGQRQNYNEDEVRFNVYIKDNISVTKRLNFEPGIRLDYLTTISKGYFQPRIKANYKLFKGVSLNVSSGLYNQFIVENLVRNPEGNNFYQWQIANDSTTKVLDAWHHVGGINSSFGRYNFKLEGFYKRTFGLTRTILDQESTETTNEGLNRSYGMDFFFEKKFRRHSFWASYTYSVSEELFNEKIGYRPSSQDQRHEVKGAAILNFNPIYFSTNYVYGSGLPNIEPGKSASDIVTPYNRWDIAVSYKTQKKKTKIETGISVINVLNTENIRYNDFLNRTDGKTFYSTAMPFTPSLFLNLGF